MPTVFALDQYRFGIPAIILGVIAAIVCQTLLKRCLGHETIRKCHEVGGYYLSIVGTFYAVLIGLIVFEALSKYQLAEQSVENESKSLIAIHTLAKRFPEQEQSLRPAVRAYADEVIATEWAKSGERHDSPKARVLLMRIIDTILSIEPRSDNQRALYPILTAEAVSLWENRRARTRATNFRIPTAEWVVLILGASITIIFTYFFTIDSHFIHLVMTGMMTLLVSMSLYLILLFGDPFSGDMRVSNSSLLLAQGVMRALE